MKGAAKCRMHILLLVSVVLAAVGAMMGTQAGVLAMLQPDGELEVEKKGLISFFGFNCWEPKLMIGLEGGAKEEIAVDWAYINFEKDRAILSLRDRKLQFDMKPGTKQGPPEPLPLASIEYLGQEVVVHSRYGTKESLPKGWVQVLPSQKLLWIRELKGDDAVWEKWYTLDTVFSRQHTYRLSNLDDRESAYTIAWAQAKELLLDELAGLVKTEIDSESNLPASLLAIDKVKAALPCIIEVRAEEQWQDRELSLGVVALASPENDAKFVSQLLKRQRLVADMERSRELLARAISDIQELQRNNDSTRDPTETSEPYSEAVSRLRALNWCDRARRLAYVGATDQAVAAYTSAIEASRGLAMAYKNRGILHAALKDDDKANSDRISATQAYGRSALAHQESGRYTECLEDAQAALALSPEYAHAYYQRATCSIGLGRQETVRDDLVKAAQLGHKSAQRILAAKGISWEKNAVEKSLEGPKGSENPKQLEEKHKRIEEEPKRRD